MSRRCWNVCRLERLELTFCGRGLTESAAAALAAAGPLDALQVLAFRGAYRLSDTALCSILRNISNLQVLRLPQNSLLTGESIKQLPSLLPPLRSAPAGKERSTCLHACVCLHGCVSQGIDSCHHDAVSGAMQQLISCAPVHLHAL